MAYLLFLLEELFLHERDLLAVLFGQSLQGRLVRLVQPLDEVALLRLVVRVEPVPPRFEGFLTPVAGQHVRLLF